MNFLNTLIAIRMNELKRSPLYAQETEKKEEVLKKEEKKPKKQLAPNF